MLFHLSLKINIKKKWEPQNVTIEDNEPLYVDLCHSLFWTLVIICTVIEGEIYFLNTKVPI